MLLSLVWLVLALVSSALPTEPELDRHPQFNSRKCSDLRVRYEWRDLRTKDKQDYIAAVKCLQKLTPRTRLPEIRSRYDEFVISHVHLTDAVHVVAQFLPWHRYYIFLQETALREECGYRGPIPYWNWSLDADSKKPLNQSPVFDSKTGFGGDGVPGTYTIPPDPLHLGAIDIYAYGKGCVQSGPFKDYSLTIGPGKLFTSHCLVRNINETYRSYLTSSAIHNLMQQPNYSSFRSELEGIPSTTDRRVHDAGHLVVGGDMGNPYSSPTGTSIPLPFAHVLTFLTPDELDSIPTLSVFQSQSRPL